ncbi:MAG TPA: radical SAM family heme chaperone HemW [Dongiaceae bacterium]
MLLLNSREECDGGFGLYIHWPFCRSKCPYCDFNSHVRESVDQERWRRALLAELDHYAQATAGRRLDSVFFGGGTPSLMPPATVAALIERIAHHWPDSPDLEITLEANPTSVEAANFAALAEAGVNRVSLGIQALDDAALKFLGRTHSAGEGLAALDIARRHFARFNFDLIYTRPGQSVAGWMKELEQALALAGEHLSLYQLTIEANTAFEGAYRRGDFVLPDEETAAELYEATRDRLAGAGLPAYEISNHARPGAECRHNLVYWQGGDYVGIGPGAHGRLTIAGSRYVTRQHRAPEAWLASVESQGHATREYRALSPAERQEELLLMGLRLSRGISRQRFHQALGSDIEEAIASASMAPLIDGGFLELDETGLRATPAGLQRLNAVLAALVV